MVYPYNDFFLTAISWFYVTICSGNVFGASKSFITEVIKIQGVQPRKSLAPPLQPKRLGRIGSFFGERTIMWILLGAPRRFLNFVLKAEIWAHLWAFEGSSRGPKSSKNRLVSPLLGWNSKIASVPLKVFTWGVSCQKMSQFGPGIWAVGRRGGAIDLSDSHLVFRSLL